jgi:hypothetical protein
MRVTDDRRGDAQCVRRCGLVMMNGLELELRERFMRCGMLVSYRKSRQTGYDYLSWRLLCRRDLVRGVHLALAT